MFVCINLTISCLKCVCGRVCMGYPTFWCHRKTYLCCPAVKWMPVPLFASLFAADLYEPCSLTRVCVFLSLSHSNVCPPTGQCPNGLSCFPSLSLCKYSGSPSDFTRTRPLRARLFQRTHTTTHTLSHTQCAHLSLPSHHFFFSQIVVLQYKTGIKLYLMYHYNWSPIPVINHHKKKAHFKTSVCKE